MGIDSLDKIDSRAIRLSRKISGGDVQIISASMVSQKPDGCFDVAVVTRWGDDVIFRFSGGELGSVVYVGGFVDGVGGCRVELERHMHHDDIVRLERILLGWL